MPTEPVRVTLDCLAIDLTTAEVVRAMHSAGVRPLLLKGPSFAAWLYAGGAVRPYRDTDLLVAPEDEGPSERVLASLGFASHGPSRHDGVARHHTWLRGRAVVELHVTLVGVSAPPAVLWRAFSTGSEKLRVGGVDVSIPAEPARALHAALHAAQHGIAFTRGLDDLVRALRIAPPGAWTAAAQMAEQVRATEAFAAGLRLVADGRTLASKLGLDERMTTAVALRAVSASTIAHRLDRLAATPRNRRPAQLVRSVFPNPDFMRWWSPLARRGWGGLALAYAWRPLWGVLHLPAGLRAWRKAQRTAGSPK